MPRNPGDIMKPLRWLSALTVLLACMALLTAPADAVETLRRNLSERGFDLSVSELPELSCSLVGAQGLCELLAALHVTGDDLVVVVGNYETLSVAS